MSALTVVGQCETQLSLTTNPREASRLDSKEVHGEFFLPARTPVHRQAPRAAPVGDDAEHHTRVQIHSENSQPSPRQAASDGTRRHRVPPAHVLNIGTLGEEGIIARGVYSPQEASGEMYRWFGRSIALQN